ncbi:TNF receptor-associated factor 2-like isoform X1 [Lampetra planeri]
MDAAARRPRDVWEADSIQQWRDRDPPLLQLLPGHVGASRLPLPGSVPERSCRGSEIIKNLPRKPDAHGMAEGRSPGERAMCGYPRALLARPGGGAPGAAARFACGSCEGLLRDAVQTHCGHRFCRPCIARLITQNVNPLCPLCQDENAVTTESVLSLNSFFPDAALRREMGVLPVRCVSEGCEWRGLLLEYDAHVERCDWVLVPCLLAGCALLLPRAELHRHVAQECSVRPVPCAACAQLLPYRQLQKHQLHCRSRRTRECKLCGQKSIPEDKWQHHEERRCLKNRDTCPYSPLGCLYRVGAAGHGESLHDHEKNSVEVHLAIVYDAFKKTFEQLIKGHADNIKHPHKPTLDETQCCLSKTRNHAQQQMQAPHAWSHTSRLAADELLKQLQSLEARAEALKNESNASLFLSPSSLLSVRNVRTVRGGEGFERGVSARLVAAEAQLAAMDRRMEEVAKRVERDVRVSEASTRQGNIDRDGTARLQNKMARVEHSDQETERSLLGLTRRLAELENTAYNGMFLWKIKHVINRLREAGSGAEHPPQIDSPAFFTTRYGYRLRLRLCRSGEHVSAYAMLGPGPYDATLAWPYQLKTTISIQNPAQRRSKKVSLNIKPWTQPSNPSFVRPSGGWNPPFGEVGFLQFSKMRDYVTSNGEECLFLKAEVEDT